MSEYSTLLGEAILRSRARTAEETAQVKIDLMSRIKSEFVSNMSHELRTPLNTIIGFSNILKQHQDRPQSDEAIVEYANMINDAAVHLLLIINDILDISKLQSGRYTLDAREVDLLVIIEQQLVIHNTQAHDAQVEIRPQLNIKTLPVRGDEDKLGQLFGNLIDNAIKFTNPGGVITIKAHRISDGGSSVTIHNSGSGMSEEEISIALMPFGQVDGSRSRWREGTGLGLPIAKALAELHGGCLTISSTRNNGTLVSVELPSPDLVLAMRDSEILSKSSSQTDNSVSRSLFNAPGAGQ